MRQALEQTTQRDIFGRMSVSVPAVDEAENKDKSKNWGENTVMDALPVPPVPPLVPPELLPRGTFGITTPSDLYDRAMYVSLDSRIKQRREADDATLVNRRGKLEL